MAVSLTRPPAPRVTAYGPYGASRVAAPYRPTAQGYAYRPPRQTPFQAASQEHGAAGYGNYGNYPNVSGLTSLAGQVGQGLPGVGVSGVSAPGAGPGMNLGGIDYSALIGGDYGVQEAESMMASRMGRARGDFQSQLRQMLVDLGVTDKSKLGSLGQYIDQDTIANAAANKYSKMAQVSQQETQANAQNQAALAARGILTSGQMTSDLENVTAQAENARYQGLRDFLSGGAQGLTQLADLQDQLASGVAQARAAAADRAAQEYYWQNMMGGGGGGYGVDPYGTGAVSRALSQINGPAIQQALSNYFHPNPVRRPAAPNIRDRLNEIGSWT